MSNGSRFHIEINSIKVEDFSVRFNIFGDTLPEVTHDLEQVIAYVTGQADIPAFSSPVPSIAPRIPPSGRPAAVPAVPAAAAPVLVTHCFKCGSSNVELVTGTRKDSGKQFSAYRCQVESCKAWQPVK